MHFLVFVISATPDEQLAPFQENNSGTCPEEYLEFFDVEEDYREKYQSEILFEPENEVHHLKPMREVFPTFDAYMAEVYGPKDERIGRYGDWFNPDAEYDWYVFGGRWIGHLILKPGRTGKLGTPALMRSAVTSSDRADQARKGDIDFLAMGRESCARLLTGLDEMLRAGKSFNDWAKQRCGIPDTITTREKLSDYALRRSQACAPAAVVFNGEWFGPWWIKDELTEAAAEKWDAWYSALLASLPNDTLLTVVDCHM
jgi:hypothetical protein